MGTPLDISARKAIFEARSVSQISSSSDKQIKIEGYGEDDESSTKKIKKVFEDKTKESQNLTGQRKLSSSSSSSGSSGNSSTSNETTGDRENDDKDIIDKLNDMCNLKTQQIKSEQEKEGAPNTDSNTI